MQKKYVTFVDNKEVFSITKYIDKSIDSVSFYENIPYREFIEKVRALEEEQQKKAKEEELTRVVEILDKEINEEKKAGEYDESIFNSGSYRYERALFLQEVKERILSGN